MGNLIGERLDRLSAFLSEQKPNVDFRLGVSEGPAFRGIACSCSIPDVYAGLFPQDTCSVQQSFGRSDESDIFPVANFRSSKW